MCVICYWIEFANNLSNNFASMFMRNICCLSLWCLCLLYAEFIEWTGICFLPHYFLVEDRYYRLFNCLIGYIHEEFWGWTFFVRRLLTTNSTSLLMFKCFLSFYCSVSSFSPSKNSLSFHLLLETFWHFPIVLWPVYFFAF